MGPNSGPEVTSEASSHTRSAFTGQANEQANPDQDWFVAITADSLTYNLATSASRLDTS